MFTVPKVVGFMFFPPDGTPFRSAVCPPEVSFYFQVIQADIEGALSNKPTCTADIRMFHVEF